jgi:hypothetical protein
MQYPSHPLSALHEPQRLALPSTVRRAVPVARAPQVLQPRHAPAQLPLFPPPGRR